MDLQSDHAFQTPKRALSTLSPDHTERHAALDIMRGLTIALMILVNNPGTWQHVYAPFRHAVWHGCTPTDLVFPFFLFVVGASMYFSLQKYGQGLDRKALTRIARRTLIIFAIGLFLNAFPPWTTDWSRLRFLGVLQRIALAYAAGAILILTGSRRRLIFISAVLLLVHTGILVFFGGPEPFCLEQNAALSLDRFLIPEPHLYQGYGTPFDPEGLLGTLTAIVTLLCGYGAAGIIRESPPGSRLRRLFIAGLGFTATGWTLGTILPINKALWTGSYVLFTAGLAAVLLGLLVWITEDRGLVRWAHFFRVFGMNPLFLFALSGVWGRLLARVIRIPIGEGTFISGSTWLHQTLFVPLAAPNTASLLYALAHLAGFWFIGWILYRRRIFIKV
jgi:predicted acyltransferase